MVQNNSVTIWAKRADILNEPWDREGIHTECLQNKYRYRKMDVKCTRVKRKALATVYRDITNTIKLFITTSLGVLAPQGAISQHGMIKNSQFNLAP
jgi:hypothetical protein